MNNLVFWIIFSSIIGTVGFFYEFNFLTWLVQTGWLLQVAHYLDVTTNQLRKIKRKGNSK